MKEFIKKITIVFLIISFILSSVNISVFQVFASEISDVQETSNTAVESNENDLLKSGESDNQEGESEKSVENKNGADVDVDGSEEESTDADEGTTGSSKNTVSSSEGETGSNKKTVSSSEDTAGSSKNTANLDEEKDGSDKNSENSNGSSTTPNENLNNSKDDSENSEETSKGTSKNSKESSNDNENEADGSEVNSQDQQVGNSLDEEGEEEDKAETLSLDAESNEIINNSETQPLEETKGIDSDFSWYYENSDGEVDDSQEHGECDVDGIDEVIKNANKNIVIKVNKSVKLNSALTFDKKNIKYTLDLQKNTLTVVENSRFIDVEKNANVTVKNGTLKGGNNTEVVFPSPEGMTPEDVIQANVAALNKCKGVICCCGGSLTIENLNIEENKSKSDGVVYVDGGKLTAENSNIKNNTAEKGGGIDLRNNAECKITDCIIEGNNQKTSTNTFQGGTGIYIYEASLDADGLKVISNGRESQTVCAGIFIQNNLSANNVTLRNSLISDNYGCKSPSRACAAGMTIAGGDVTLENTVIKNNIGYYCGGVGMYPATTGGIKFEMTEGAIYDNIASNTENGVLANDIEIQTVKSKTITVDIPEACKMKDGESINFSEFCWGCKEGENGYCKKESNINLTLTGIDSNKYLYSARTKENRCVAQINDKKYTSITAAVAEANNGDTIKLIAGDYDKIGPTINEEVIVNDSIDEKKEEPANTLKDEQEEEPDTNEKKSITINLNGKNWTGGNSMLNALTLENENIDITITGGGSISSIDLKRGNLTLDSNASISTICLAKGKSVIAGDNFATDKLESNILFKLNTSSETGGDSETSKEKLDEELGKNDIQLIKSQSSKDISEDILKNIVIMDTNSLVIVKKDKNGNVVAHKLKAIYINGSKEDDESDTDGDSEVGMDIKHPVKTLSKVNELLEKYKDKNIETVAVTGTITITGDEELSLPEGVSLKRYDTMNGYLIKVKNDNELTLTNITIDGQGDKIEADHAMIYVEPKAVLNINEGTNLINNSNKTHQSSHSEAGGAVYCEGTLNMNGGEISGNTSWYGGGIEVYGTGAVMNMDGGSVVNNKAVSVSSALGNAGGGIAVMGGAKLNMNDGEVSNNGSSGNLGVGGGIMVGEKVYIYSTSVTGSTFIMNGGKISENFSTVDGGGIYIQCKSTGTIKAGEISYNHCEGPAALTGAEGDYGGGGIYVNGKRHGEEEGKLYITNAYISNNTSGGGLAIAGCGTSTVKIYPEGATIYNSKIEEEGKSKKAQIYVDSTQQSGYGTDATIDISRYSTDGELNHWYDIKNNTELSYEQLHKLDAGSILQINNTNEKNLDEQGELYKVKIIGNTAGRRGGGIGTNGFVQIGGETYVDIEVTKEWKDNNDQDSKRPESIKVTLYEGEKVKDTKIISEAEDWKCTFKHLPKYDYTTDEKIIYTIKEDTVDGYSTEIKDYNIVNTRSVDIEGTKTWDDNDNQDGQRPSSITVNLLADGIIVNSQKVTEADGWAYSFEGLPKYDGEKEIKYTIDEENVDNYIKEIDGNNLKNTYSIDITGTKTWNDNENQDGKRPESIKVHLYSDDVEINSKEVTAEDGWEYSFTGLPKYSDGKEINYTIKEDEVPDYTTEINEYNITNTHTPETIEIKGTKTWEDNNNQDGKRPDKITIYLYADGEQVAFQEISGAEANEWEYSFKDFPKYKNGHIINYTINESDVENYTKKIEEYNITNTHIPATVDISGTKTWNDNNNQDGKRPDKITVYLLADGKLEDSKDITEEDGWRYSFTELPEYSNGQKIQYTIDEEEVKYYEKEINGYDITNTHTPETVVIGGTKTWKDNDNQDGKRPDKIIVYLLANGKQKASKVVTEADGWAYSFEGLPKYSEGQEIKYTIDEEVVAEYTKEVDGYNVTNTHTPETVVIGGTKTWKDNDNQDGKRPDKIIVNLLANGEKIDSKEVTEKDEWKYVFRGLPKYSKGQEIRYTIDEEVVADYTKEVDGYNVTNTHTPETVDISGIKTWNDNEDQDGKRPEKITVYLLADGEQKYSKEITEADGWAYSFEGLPKYSDGEEIEYTVDEGEVEDYTKEIIGYNITNTHIPETVVIGGTKTWNDNDNQDGKRPEKIIVNLLANGEKIDSKEVTEADEWSYLFTGLPKYSKGQEIKYTIDEEIVAEYTKEVNGYNITNTHIPETVVIGGTKTWNDNDNQDGKRPEKIIIHVYADGQEVDSKEVTEADGWKYVFRGLPKYSKGQEIKYTIDEEVVADYTKEVDGYNVTNTHTPETVDISGTKTWNDNEDQDGKRPDSIIVYLLANGKKVDSKEVTEADEWKYSFTGLAKYNKGQEITYTIDEEVVVDYTKEIDGYNLINTHIPKDVDEDKDEDRDGDKDEDKDENIDINTKPETPKEYPKTGDNILMNITVWLISIINGIVIIKKEIFN